MYKIVSFYEFKDISEVHPLEDSKRLIRSAMRELGVSGTVILAEEGFNAAFCGEGSSVDTLVHRIEDLFATRIEPKISYSEVLPFRRVEVKVKPEIVTLKKDVDIAAGEGTHVEPSKWNELVSDPDVILLDTRNDYEYKTGTFKGAINPKTTKFSELVEYVDRELAERKDEKIAIFCTGGIRCEKFAPYLLAQGFLNVYQLKGGILKYLEEVPKEESLWGGECFVFDQRISLDHDLEIGDMPDLSQSETIENEAASG